MTPAKNADDSQVSLQLLMGPEHGNALGNVHGGVIMKMVDEAGAIAAMRHAQRPCVTIAIDSMTFKQPVHLGELMVCGARVSYVGRTSIEVRVHVHSENLFTRERNHTNSAYVVYVALGADGKPCAVPGLVPTNAEDEELFAAGALRQKRRTSST